MKQQTIAHILIDMKAATSEQIDAWQIEADQLSLPFEEYIQNNGLLSEEVFARVLAEKFSLPVYTSISEKYADPDLLAKVSLPFLRKNIVMPILVSGKVVLLTADPYHVQALDELALVVGQGSIAVAPRGIISEAINRYYPLEGAKEMIEELQDEQESINSAEGLGAISEEDILGMVSDAPIIKLVNHVLFQAVKRGASDVHVEPFEKEVRVRYRVDGVLYEIMTPPKRLQGAIASRIKVMSNLNIAEKRQPQDGRIQIKIADRAIDIRVSILPVSYGERVVMRLLDKSKTFGNLDQIGFSERDYKVVEQGMHQPNGILLLTGPTGSGKTSTLYSILGELNSSDVNIITVEDPVEYQMKGIGQVQVKEQVGLTFAAALRSILRQDPDIIMIGETRDQETAQIAIQSALTGHLVLSTLHTNSAAATITRLIDMGVEPFLIASSVTVVIAQRLVRRLCDQCKKEYQPPADILEQVGLTIEAAKKTKFYMAVGCEQCANLGYKGRLAVFEVMQMSNNVMHLTLARAETAQIQEQARKDGMNLLLEDGLRKAAMGLTTIDEVLSVSTLGQQV